MVATELVINGDDYGGTLRLVTGSPLSFDPQLNNNNAAAPIS